MSNYLREVPDEDARPMGHQHYSQMKELMNTKDCTSPSTSQDLSINRKWVKQMKKRIREFVSNTSNFGGVELNHQSSETNLDLSSQLSPEFGVQRQNEMGMERTIRNFGIHLEKCESSSISPVSI